MQEALYLAYRAPFLGMHAKPKSPLQDAHAAFAEKATWLRKRAGLSQIELERAVKKRGDSISQKSVSNIETLKHDSQLGNYAAIAEYFGVPLWAMFVPGLSVDLLEGEKLRRLTSLVENYLTCDNSEREHIENMARGYAGLARSKKV